METTWNVFVDGFWMGLRHQRNQVIRAWDFHPHTPTSLQSGEASDMDLIIDYG